MYVHFLIIDQNMTEVILFQGQQSDPSAQWTEVRQKMTYCLHPAPLYFLHLTTPGKDEFQRN